MNVSRFSAFYLLGAIALWTDLASAQPSPNRAVGDEFLIKFRPGTSPEQRSTLLGTEGARLIRHFDAIDIDHVALPPGTDRESALRTLLASGEVLLAQPNYIRHVAADAPPDDPSWREDSLWSLIKIQAQPTWWEYGSGDGSVVLADIDTGVNYNHPDLASNIWQNPGEIPGNNIDDDGNGHVDDVHGIDTINHDSDPMDDEGHGTHTTGIMAAVGNNNAGIVGVSWNSKIIICKFLDATGAGSDAGAIKCFDYLIALKKRGINIRATNNSWGDKLSPGDPFPFALQAAFDAAGAEDILNVCAAGNFGTNNDSAPYHPATFDSPSIISVAATERDDNRTWFTNYGAVSVDLAAPGSFILSTIGSGYDYLSGTSMATPHVTGAAALLAQLNPGITRETIKSLLLSNVDVLPNWSGLLVTSGRLNVFRATQAAVAGSEPFQISTVKKPELEVFELTWEAVPGIRYQVYSTSDLTSAFTSLGGVMVAGPGESALTFTDLAASGSGIFYQVETVP